MLRGWPQAASRQKAPAVRDLQPPRDPWLIQTESEYSWTPRAGKAGGLLVWPENCGIERWSLRSPESVAGL